MPKVLTGSGSRKKVGWQTWTRTTGIYRIRNLITNERYIGLSKDIGERWKSHLYQLETGTHHNTPLQESWNEHGITNFAFEVCEVCYKKDLAQKEIEWWDKENAEGFSLFNGRPSGRAYPEPTDATRKKLSKAASGRKHSEKAKRKLSKAASGRTFSEETRKKLSEALTGRKKTEEHIRNMSKARTGRKLSEEHKRNVSKAMTGKNGIPVIQMDLEGNVIQEWASATEAERQLGLHGTSITKCCKGKLSQTGGFKWRYAC